MNKSIQNFGEFSSTSQHTVSGEPSGRFSVICKWVENGEQKWDVVDAGPLSIKEAERIASDTRKVIAAESKLIQKEQIVILPYSEYQDKLKDEGY